MIKGPILSRGLVLLLCAEHGVEFLSQIEQGYYVRLYGLMLTDYMIDTFLFLRLLNPMLKKREINVIWD